MYIFIFLYTVWVSKISELGLRGAPVSAQMSFGPKLDGSATRICMSLCTTFGIFDLRGLAWVKFFPFFNFVHDVLHDPDPNIRPVLIWRITMVYNYMVIWYQNTRGNANNRDARANFSKLGRMNQSRPTRSETCSGVLRKFWIRNIRFAGTGRRFKFWTGTLRRNIQYLF